MLLVARSTKGQALPVIDPWWLAGKLQDAVVIGDSTRLHWFLVSCFSVSVSTQHQPEAFLAQTVPTHLNKGSLTWRIFEHMSRNSLKRPDKLCSKLLHIICSTESICPLQKTQGMQPPPPPQIGGQIRPTSLIFSADLLDFANLFC